LHATSVACVADRLIVGCAHAIKACRTRDTRGSSSRCHTTSAIIGPSGGTAEPAGVVYDYALATRGRIATLIRAASRVGLTAGGGVASNACATRAVGSTCADFAGSSTDSASTLTGIGSGSAVAIQATLARTSSTGAGRVSVSLLRVPIGAALVAGQDKTADCS
jgi:hypothetical protein